MVGLKAWSDGEWLGDTGPTLDTTNFDGLLSSSDTTPQAAFETLDEVTASDVGAGDASGPASATDSAVALFDGTGGKTLKDSAVTISTDEDLTSDSDSKIPTEQAVKAYVDANAAGGGGAWEVVSETTLASDTATVSLTGLSGYSKVQVIYTFRGTANSGAVLLYMQLNSDTGANYNHVADGYHNGPGGLATHGSAATYMQIGRGPGAQTNTDRLATGEVTVFCPSASARKQVQGVTSFSDSTSEQVGVFYTAGTWKNTADAVSSIQFKLNTGSFASGSTFLVLGRA